MKYIHKLLLALMFSAAIHFPLFAQSNSQADDLIKQGVELNSQNKYPEAIDKFNEALKTDAENGYANYQLAFSLYKFKKPAEAIPHLEIAIKTGSANISMAADVLLAGIYDEGKQPQKAIETYNAAIKINPDYPQIHYNLGLAYFRNQQYAEAEMSAIEAIKRNPKDASSQRLYALVCFHQNKLGVALMGFCSFLLLEPTGTRAAEAFGNIQHIIDASSKDVKGTIAVASSAPDAEEAKNLNASLSAGIKEASNKKLEGLDLLEYQLKSTFIMAGQLAEKHTEQSFFDKFFAGYFYKLAQSGNVPAFTHLISNNANPTVNAKWLKDNAQRVQALNDWVGKMERGF